ncbi:5-oxoprolinase subunit B family protein [Larsenimonas rhizosphaerae]|uniref:5-oxoprolinase subunit B family protein n=1 Tax=Larsenimonas rhizosphaerae TaxID=2944682 RepID=UPI0020343AA4|nr:allophanate hydrolase subunit 1 [Larsenimonas rhizosphaerae]MCM2130369.1 allophanate hydrolase subunit 1 [Larsenimonas rhizosphaerae]
MTPVIERAGLDSVMIRLFDTIDVSNMDMLLSVVDTLKAELGEALIDVTPSYTTVLLHYDVYRMGEAAVRGVIQQVLRQPVSGLSGNEARTHVLPVWYDSSVGPELDLLAHRFDGDFQEVITRHQQMAYRVFALGFAPGFGFMGVVDEQLETPRLATPRKRVPKGSIGIAGRQTAAYPADLPGGWNIIGRTPVALFDRTREGYTLYRTGDVVRFEAVSRQTFLDLGGDATPFAGGDA